MPENPALWHTEKYGWGRGSAEDKAAQAYKMMILDALHALGRPATFLEIADWVWRAQPRHYVTMRGYVWTFGQEAHLRADGPLATTVLKQRYAGWPAAGSAATWEEQSRYTLTERIQWYAEVMRRHHQLVTAGAGPLPELDRDRSISVQLGRSRQGLKLYARGPKPLIVDRFRVREASAHTTYDPATPDWWVLHAQARADLREMLAAARSPERRAQIDNVRRVLHQIEHFYDEVIPMREEDI